MSGVMLQGLGISPAAQQDVVQLSRLTGPPLDVPITSALQMLEQAFARYHDHIAVVSLYQPSNYLDTIFQSDPRGLEKSQSPTYLRWTYGQLKRAGRLLATSFATHGVREGMTIAAFVRGSVEFYMLLYAALLLRCRFSPMNYTAIAHTIEVQHMLQLVEADVLVAMDEQSLNRLLVELPDAARKLVLKIAIEKAPGNSPASALAFYYFEDLVTSAFSLLVNESPLERFNTLLTEADDTVVVLFTSGTSSLPKACPLTNRILCALATGFGKSPNAGPSSVVCNHLPIYHIAGGISGGWNPLTSGATVVHPAASFTASSTLAAIRLENVTYMVLVPTMIGLLLDDPALPPEGEISLKSLSLGATTIQYTDVEKCYKYLGVQRVITSYGMTEGLMMTRGHLPREQTEEARNGIQHICAGARLKICEPNSRIIVPRGKPGEVHQGGMTTIRSYIGTESDAFYEDQDGVWCITGDQAIMYPDGGVKITGRYKDLIIRGGVNVSPQAIEGIISRLQGIEAYVVGMPDCIAGEVPVAVVRQADLGKTSLQSLREPIVRELGPRFTLERFFSLEELGLTDFPRTSTGKVRKIDLQVIIKQYMQVLRPSTQAVLMKTQTEKVEKPTLQFLIETFSDIAGIGYEGLSADTEVHVTADSLTLARYTTSIRQALGRPFTLHDVNEHVTLGAQAKLLDARSEPESENVDLATTSEGPPLAEDMVHVKGDPAIALRTRTICENALWPIGLNWSDVQHIVTPSQWLQSWVKTREASDRFRVAYITTEADVYTFSTAIKEALLANDSLRAISVPGFNSADLQIILRGSEKSMSKIISIHDRPVATTKDLEQLIPGDYQLKNGLLRIVIAHVQETGTAGACFMTLHPTFDAFSLNTVLNDLNLLLNKKKVEQHVPYKLWADHLYNQTDSARAKASVSYNVKRLQGLSTKKAALWPPQRSLVWQRGCDRGLHITHNGIITDADNQEQRRLLDGTPENCIGSTGLKRECKLHDLAILISKYRVTAQIIIKAALVMLETQLTGQSVALFTQTFSMRDNWPFIDAWASSRLPSPLEVTGPTLSRIAEAIPLDRSQTVVKWLQHLRDEQEELIKHAHAPYRAVYDELNQKSEANVNGCCKNESHNKSDTDLQDQRTDEVFASVRDGEIMESIRQRINLQWLPTFPSKKDVKKQVRVVSSTHFNEVGLAVKSGILPDHQTVWIRMQWDDGNIRRAEATAWIDAMIKYVEILGKKENWERRIEELGEGRMST